MSEKGVGTAQRTQDQRHRQEWVLLLLNQCSEEVRSKQLFMWWRSCHMRNNNIFCDGKYSVKQSVQFIKSYLTSFLQVNYSNLEPDIKGKNLAT
jgi:hypothetical protein